MEIDFTLPLQQLQRLINNFLNSIPSLLISMLILATVLIVARYLKRLVRGLLETSGRPRSLALVLGRLTEWTMVGLGSLVALLVVFPDFSAGQLIQLLGFGSLAAGLAFRNIIEDFFAGVLLLLNEPFSIGDQIVVQDLEGTIENIEARVTYIRTYDGRRIIIPNADLFTNTVTVNTAYAFRRIEYDIGIGYSDSIDQARQTILDALTTLDEVEEHPAPEVIIYDLAAYSVVLRVRWWIRPPRRSDAVDTRNRVLRVVKQALLDAGIDMPFPTQQILFHDQTEATDGDRRRQREGWPAGPGDVPRSYRIADAVGSLKTGRDGGSKSRRLNGNGSYEE
jgi:small-conductance mechanosensitive channel